MYLFSIWVNTKDVRCFNSDVMCLKSSNKSPTGVNDCSICRERSLFQCKKWYGNVLLDLLC